MTWLQCQKLLRRSGTAALRGTTYRVKATQPSLSNSLRGARNGFSLFGKAATILVIPVFAPLFIKRDHVLWLAVLSIASDLAIYTLTYGGTCSEDCFSHNGRRNSIVSRARKRVHLTSYGRSAMSYEHLALVFGPS